MSNVGVIPFLLDESILETALSVSATAPARNAQTKPPLLRDADAKLVVVRLLSLLPPVKNNKRTTARFRDRPLHLHPIFPRQELSA